MRYFNAQRVIVERLLPPQVNLKKLKLHRRCGVTTLATLTGGCAMGVVLSVGADSQRRRRCTYARPRVVLCPGRGHAVLRGAGLRGEACWACSCRRSTVAVDTIDSTVGAYPRVGGSDGSKASGMGRGTPVPNCRHCRAIDPAARPTSPHGGILMLHHMVLFDAST